MKTFVRPHPSAIWYRCDSPWQLVTRIIQDREWGQSFSFPETIQWLDETGIPYIFHVRRGGTGTLTHIAFEMEATDAALLKLHSPDIIVSDHFL
jgi:hypothetical protein